MLWLRVRGNLASINFICWILRIRRKEFLRGTALVSSEGLRSGAGPRVSDGAGGLRE